VAVSTELVKSPLEAWIARLGTEEIPAFAHTARLLASVSREDDSSANDLANVILRDGAMAARISRLANRARFNVSGRPIETVSYALVVLGFEHVHNMALTISMIDTVLDPVQKHPYNLK
jgi:HD-like signal output (HDOD) protein